MRTARVRTLGTTLAAAAVAGGAGYLWAQWSYQPKLVEVQQTACGIPPSTASFAVPLEAALRSGGELPIAVGPIDIPDGGGFVVLRFDPAVDGRGRDVRMIDELLVLPTAYGRDATLPERITVTCRDGAIASVRYQSGRRGGSIFSVLHERAAAMAGDEADVVAPPAARLRVAD